MHGCPQGTCLRLADIAGEAVFAYQNINHHPFLSDIVDSTPFLELLCDELRAVVTSYVARLTIEPYHFLKDIADKVDWPHYKGLHRLLKRVLYSGWQSFLESLPLRIVHWLVHAIHLFMV